MTPLCGDQAEGLRRLLGAPFVRVLAVAGGSHDLGRTAIVVNLASALAQRGRRVLVLDEGNGVAARLGRVPRAGLNQVLDGTSSWSDALCAHDGLHVLAAEGGDGGAAGALAAAPRAAELLHELFTRVLPNLDVLLLQPAAGTGRGSVALTLAAQEALLVLTPRPRAITATYALVKLLAREYGQCRFQILLSRVAAGDAQAVTVLGNVADAARQFLGVRPRSLGQIPADERLPRSERLARPLVEVFPDSPAALAFRKMAAAIDQWPRPGEADIPDLVHRLLHCGDMAGQDAPARPLGTPAP